MPSSSASSRINAASGVSPASILPPGNSHRPAIDFPAGRWASSTRPSVSTSATAATSTTRRPPPSPAGAGAPGRPPAGAGVPGEGWGRSAAVAGIDVDVAMGQIAGPHRRLAAADADIDGDRDLAAFHMLGDRRLVIAWYRPAIGEDRQTADRDRQAVGIDLLSGFAH